MTQLVENQAVDFHLPASLDPQTRLWFYTTDRELTDRELVFLNEKLADFLPAWTAHNRSLKAWATVFFNRILLIAVDETQAGVSGCGIDKSVHFLETLGDALSLDFFERVTIGFENGAGVIEFLPLGQFSKRVKSGELSAETRILDNLVSTKMEFENGWLKPVRASWVNRFL